MHNPVNPEIMNLTILKQRKRPSSPNYSRPSKLCAYDTGNLDFYSEMEKRFDPAPKRIPKRQKRFNLDF